MTAPSITARLALALLAAAAAAGCAGGDTTAERSAAPATAAASQPAAPAADWRQRLSGVSLPILGYHHVGADAKPGDVYSVRTTDFAAQMRYLRQQKFRPISLGQLTAFLEQGAPLPEKPILITFDDGYQSTLTTAAPIMKANGIDKATFFVYTSFVDSGYKGTIRWQELKRLEREFGFEVQCHTFTHPLMTAHDSGKGFKFNPKKDAPEPDADYVKRIYETQLVYPKRRIEQQLGHPVTHLAWPFGLYNKQVVDLARKAGFKYLYTINPSPNDVYTSPDGLRRFLITYGVGERGLAQLLGQQSLVAADQAPADGQMLREPHPRFGLKLLQAARVDPASLRAQIDGETVPVKWDPASGTASFANKRPFQKRERFHEVQVWGTGKDGRGFYKTGWAFFVS